MWNRDIHAFCRKSDHVNNTQNNEIINVNFCDENFLSVVKSIIDEKMIIIIFSEWHEDFLNRSNVLWIIQIVQCILSVLYFL